MQVQVQLNHVMLSGEFSTNNALFELHKLRITKNGPMC